MVVKCYRCILEQSNLTYKDEGEVDEFIDEIENLKASGGGDCPEYTFNGMIAAIEEGPELGSPLIVFTDAPPKDADENDNLNGLIALAGENEVNINFFTHETCDSFPFKGFELFKQLSAETGGQYLPMEEYELRSLAKFTDAKLGTLAAVKTGESVARTRRRRSTVDEILIALDDTVDRLVVSTTTENSATDVSLRAPSGIAWDEGKNIMTNAAVYIVDLPADGDWKLEVPVSAGEYRYSVKVSSKENINFKHDFKKSVNRRKVDLKYPLAGEQAEVELRMAGEKQIKKDSLRVDIVDTSGEVLIPDLKPTPNGADGVYFTVTFNPPKEKFKMMLKGMTKKNKVFTRVSERPDEVKPLVLKKFYNSRGDFIRPGGSVFLMLYLFNGKDSNQVFRISFKDTLGYSISLLGRRRLTARARSKKYLRVAVRYGGGKRGREGQNENVIILVKGPDGSIATEVVPLMVKS
ncbi:von Willebrand factor A domain-containing protein 7-like [Dendronephthya gigantea]|uniref:von Willebrand factor A domain-containing protein 7-like n=1 Tax=Dendronephthya gigantea TaxID=151771 RepID=UPI00106C0E9E|nr:von Willebrand factor A domain-containing protein 7-like [Dendronephthya gigantea]